LAFSASYLAMEKEYSLVWSEETVSSEDVELSAVVLLESENSSLRKEGFGSSDFYKLARVILLEDTADPALATIVSGSFVILSVYIPPSIFLFMSLAY